MTTKTVFPPTFSPRALVQATPWWAWQLGLAFAIYLVVSHFILAAQPDLNPHFRIDLSPLLEAPLQIQIHVAGALSAFFIGLVLLAAPKGFRFHKTLGWTWIVAMSVTAVSSFFITGIFQNAYSPIHALSAWTLIGLPFGVAAIRRRDVKKHRQTMTGMFLGGMAIAGLFTFLPGRLMWSLFIGV
ncbi:MAG: DUF2306 domain-containing protein [Pseudomonadota bacterium]